MRRLIRSIAGWAADRRGRAPRDRPAPGEEGSRTVRVTVGVEARLWTLSLLVVAVLSAGGCASDVRLTLRYPPRHGVPASAEATQPAPQPQARLGRLVLVPFADAR